MRLIGDQIVGKTMWLRHQVLLIDPLTGIGVPDPEVIGYAAKIIRPDDTLLIQRALGSGVTNLGAGWYASSFTPDVAGRHVIKIEITAQDGSQDRIKEEVVVRAY